MGANPASGNAQMPLAKPLPADEYKTLLESFAQAVWETDAQGLVVSDSPSWRAYTGQTLEQWLGEGWVSAIHPDDWRYALHQWQQAVSQQRPVNAEFRLRSPDGGWRWTNVQATAIVAPDGRVLKWVGFNIDISERKRAEAQVTLAQSQQQADELQAARNLLRATLDASMDLIQVFDAVRNEQGELVDFRWVLANHTAQKIYGDVIGQSLLHHQPAVFEAGIFAAFKQVVETGKPQQYETHYMPESFDGWFYQSVVKLGDGVATTTANITARKQAEEALQGSEERFRLFVTASSDVVYTMSVDWRQMDQLDGKTFLANTQEPSRDWLLRYIPQEDQPMVEATIEQAIATKSVFELEHRVIQADGQIGWTLSRAVPLLDQQGQLVEWFGTASDVTERVRVQEVLRESEARLVSLRPLTLLGQTEELAQVGSWDYARASDQFIWSAGMYRLFELDPAQPIQPEIYLERALSGEQAAAQRLLAHFYYGEGAFQTDLRIRVGQQIKTIRIKAQVIGEGEQQHVLGVNLDLTEQLAAQEQLGQTATNLQVVLDNSPASIGLLKAVHDPLHPAHITDFRLAVGNEKLAQFFGQPLAKLLNRSAQRFASLLWGDQTLDKLRQIYQNKTYLYEEKRLSLAGQDRWLALSAVSQDGGVIITGLDITELKQTQDRQQSWLDELETARHSVEDLAALRASLDQRTELMRGFSHDLRANFSLIVGGLELFDSADSEQDRAQTMAIVTRNVQQATSLLTDLLDLSRLESGQQQRTIAPFDVYAVFEELSLGLQSSAQERGLALQLVGPGTLVVENDRQLVYRLVQNLLVNALKYTQQGGVTLAWAASGDGWWLEVADTGPGLPPVLLEGLTTSEPLEAVPASAPPRTSHWLEGQGEGLGLRIVRELASLLDAQLQVRSEAGVGTQFRVIFP